MSDHVSMEIADFLAGRMTPERELECRRHIETCPTCATEVEFARQLVGNALKQGLTHVPAERIVAIADDPGSATPLERSHIASCETCRVELEWARTAGQSLAPDRSAVAGRPARRRIWLRPRVWVPAALAAAVAIVVFVQQPPHHEAPSSVDLIATAPLPVRIPRTGASADSFEIARLHGLEAYADGDYAAAGDRFDEALALRAEDPEVLLYAGSSRLLRGDASGAAPFLEKGLRHADTEALRADLSWQLADAYLETGDVEAARPLLKTLAQQGNGYSREARDVLKRVP